MNTEFYSLEISNVERLTKDAIAVSFSVPDELKQTFEYVQGQHLTLRQEIDGQDIRRSYSICSGVQQQQLQVGIKRIDQGVFSNFANNELKVGMKLEVMPPQGHFYTDLKSDHKKHYLFLAVGSGITPNLSHIQSVLETEPDSTVTLVYGNKNTSLMMFRNTLSFIKNQYMERFLWVNLFTREEHEAEVLNGRISGEKLQELNDKNIVAIQDFDDVFICGPEDMIKDVESALKGLGYKAEQIHYELFYSGSAEQEAKEKMAQRSQQYGEKLSRVAVKVAGRKTFIDLAMGGDNILDAAMEQGADLPFSCKGGVCATCKAKVIKGKVEMDLNHSLTEQEVADGMVLSCQAHPVTSEVEIDFDIV